MRRLHLAIGGTALVVFLLTGAYMRMREQPVAALEPGVHAMFTSRHIYILAAAVANLLLGAYVTVLPKRVAAWLQRFGTALLVLSAVLLVAAFVHEPMGGRGRTPASTFGLYALFAGTILHVGASVWDRAFRARTSGSVRSDS